MAVQCDRLDDLTLLMRVSGLVTDATTQHIVERIFDYSQLGYLILDITETMYAQVDETYLTSVIHRLVDRAEIQAIVVVLPSFSHYREVLIRVFCTANAICLLRLATSLDEALAKRTQESSLYKACQ